MYANAEVLHPSQDSVISDRDMLTYHYEGLDFIRLQRHVKDRQPKIILYLKPEVDEFAELAVRRKLQNEQLDRLAVDKEIRSTIDEMRSSNQNVEQESSSTNSLPGYLEALAVAAEVADAKFNDERAAKFAD